MNQSHQKIENAFSEQLKQRMMTTENMLPRGTEQMRYEAAKEFMAALLSTGTHMSPEYLAKQSFEHADALMESFLTSSN